MRVRLEELAHFLQQLIDAQGADVTLDTSCLTVEVTINSLGAIGHQLFKVREGLQRSIDESRMLSISVLAEQTSMLEEMDLAGLDEEEDVEQEEWTVPDIDLEDVVLEDNGALEEAVIAREAAERKLWAMESKMKLLLSKEETVNQVAAAKKDRIGSKTRVRRARSVGGVALRGRAWEGRKATSLPVQASKSIQY